MERITSPQNKKLKNLKKLSQDAGLRRETRTFVCEGSRLVFDIPPACVKELYVCEDLYADHEMKGRIGNLFAKNEQIKVFVIPPVSRVKSLFSTKSPQGVLALCDIPQSEYVDLIGAEEEGKEPFLVILESVRDPGNVGTIFRTATGAGASGLILTEDCADLFSPKVVRATMSTLFRLPFAVVPDVPGIAGSLREAGFGLFAADPSGAKLYTEADYRGACAIVIGNEANGVRTETLSCIPDHVCLPMDGGLESLNAAMAAGILMYEVRRQREA